MFLVQHYMADVYRRRTCLSELLFQLKEAVLDFILEMRWQFPLRADELRVVDVGACILNAEIEPVDRLVDQGHYDLLLLEAIPALCLFMQFNVPALYVA